VVIQKVKITNDNGRIYVVKGRLHVEDMAGGLNFVLSAEDKLYGSLAEAKIENGTWKPVVR